MAIAPNGKEVSAVVPLGSGGQYNATDVWSGADIGRGVRSLSPTLEPHGCAVVFVAPTGV